MITERIAVIGLGYVGLPVAVAFARQAERVTGFDISASRVAALRHGEDRTGEVAPEELAGSAVRFISDPAELFMRQGRTRMAIRLLNEASVFPQRGSSCLEVGYGSLGWGRGLCIPAGLGRRRPLVRVDR